MGLRIGCSFTGRESLVLPEIQRAEYWHTFFSKHDLVLSPDSTMSVYADMVWYSNGDFQVGVGINFKDNKISSFPHFSIFNRKVFLHVIDIRVADVDSRGEALIPLRNSHGIPGPGIVKVPLIPLKEFLYVVENMMVPENLPLLVGIDWVSELVAGLLEGDRNDS